MARGGWTFGTLLAVGAIVALVAIPAIPYGDLDLAEAPRILDRRMAAETIRLGEAARVDVLLAGGVAAGVPPSELDGARVVACPIRTQSRGSMNLSRYGAASEAPRHRETSYSCLFEAEDAGGLPLHLGLVITRSDDPEFEDLGGYGTHLLGYRQTGELMGTLGVRSAEIPLAGRERRPGLLAAAGYVLR
jgi:hypothetical protein